MLPNAPERPRRSRRAIRLCVALHRYLGLSLSVLLLAWFLSGFVLMYRGFPSLEPSEKLFLAESVAADTIRLSLPAAKERAEVTELASVRVGMFLGRAVFRFRDSSGNVDTIFADSGEALSVDESTAMAVVRSSMTTASRALSAESVLERDQWTPTSGYARHLPMYRVRLNDSADTVVYVSSTSGEIVQELDFRDKVWAWLGPIPHWIYFRDLRIHQGPWEWLVITLSSLALVLCAAGLAVGVLRFRRKSGSLAFSPYDEAWFRWHHYAGFFFGIFAFTWTLSGLLSMNPLGWSTSRSLAPLEESTWRGGDLDLTLFRLHPAEAVRAFQRVGAVKEVELVQIRGRGFYLAHYDAATTRLLAADRADAAPTLELREDLLLGALSDLETSPPTEARRLAEYDAYYYSARGESPPLPVLRVKFSDPPRSWYYVSPRTGAVTDRFDATSRTNRWLYHGLHSLDFPFLIRARPQWDLVVIVLMLGGTGVTLTGVVLSFRWTRRKLGWHGAPTTDAT